MHSNSVAALSLRVDVLRVLNTKRFERAQRSTDGNKKCAKGKNQWGCKKRGTDHKLGTSTCDQVSENRYHTLLMMMKKWV